MERLAEQQAIPVGPQKSTAEPQETTAEPQDSSVETQEHTANAQESIVKRQESTANPQASTTEPVSNKVEDKFHFHQSPASDQRPGLVVEISATPLAFDPRHYTRVTTTSSERADLADQPDSQQSIAPRISESTIASSKEASASAFLANTVPARTLATTTSPPQRRLSDQRADSTSSPSRPTARLSTQALPPTCAPSDSASIQQTQSTQNSPGNSGRNVPSHQPSGAAHRQLTPNRSSEGPGEGALQSRSDTRNPEFLSQPDFDQRYEVLGSSPVGEHSETISSQVKGGSSYTPSLVQQPTPGRSASRRFPASAQVPRPPISGQAEEVGPNRPSGSPQQQPSRQPPDSRRSSRSQAFSEDTPASRRLAASLLASPAWNISDSPFRNRLHPPVPDFERPAQPIKQEKDDNPSIASTIMSSERSTPSQPRNTVKPFKPATPSRANMDDNSRTPTKSTPLSTAAQLKQIQAATFRQHGVRLDGFFEPPSRLREKKLLPPSAVVASAKDLQQPSPSHKPSSSATGSAARQQKTPDSVGDTVVQSTGNASAESETRSTSSRPPISAVEERRHDLGIGLNTPTLPLGSVDRGVQEAEKRQGDSRHIPEAEGTHGANNQLVSTTTIAPSVFATLTGYDAIPAASVPGMAGDDLSTRISHDPLLGDEPRSSSEAIVTPAITSAANEYIVTLPLAANVRRLYVKTITENRPAIEAFSHIFAGDLAEWPDEATVTRIDLMFERLLNISDLPGFIDNLPSMSQRDMMKHATNSNSKFLFVHELLDGIRDLEMHILILSRSGKVMDFMEATVATTGVRFRRLGQTAYTHGDAESSLTVLVGSPEADPATLPDKVDVVIGFDESARRSSMYRQYFAQHSSSAGPTLLSLVAAHTLEHIDLRISKAMDPVERKNALVISTFQSRPLVLDPKHGYPEPHEIAQVFSSQIRDPSEEFAWKPLPIPDDVFEVYLSSQPEPPMPQGSEIQQDEDNAKSSQRKRQVVRFNLTLAFSRTNKATG